MPSHTATYQLTDPQAKKLHNLLRERGFDEVSIPYAEYAFRKEGLSVALYTKKNKLLLQGKGVEDFILFTLEPEITGQFSYGYESVLDPSQNTPHFGIDESGKGDFFGPLVIAGVYTDAVSAPILREAGVCDSKTVSGSAKIRTLAKLIKSTPGVEFEVVCISPQRYNEMYASFKNLNTLLAWGHTRVIGALLARRPDCPRALSDQFAHESVLKRALKQQGLDIKLEQRTKAESDIAVAAASILAREKFVDWMDKASQAGHVKLPLGASAAVIKAGREAIARHGEDILPKLAKMHFKTTAQVLRRQAP